MTKRPLSEAMLNEMALEMALEAKREADHGKGLLTQMLMLPLAKERPNKAN
jgi:hypothetical protein